MRFSAESFGNWTFYQWSLQESMRKSQLCLEELPWITLRMCSFLFCDIWGHRVGSFVLRKRRASLYFLWVLQFLTETRVLLSLKKLKVKCKTLNCLLVESLPAKIAFFWSNGYCAYVRNHKESQHGIKIDSRKADWKFPSGFWRNQWKLCSCWCHRRVSLGFKRWKRMFWVENHQKHKKS